MKEEFAEALLSMYSREGARHEEDSKPTYHLLTAIHHMVTSLGIDSSNEATVLLEILHLQDVRVLSN